MPVDNRTYPGEKGSMSVLLSDDGQAVSIQMSCVLGDSGLDEHVLFVVSRDGKWRRFVCPRVVKGVWGGGF